jgi:hypothetical protein
VSIYAYESFVISRHCVFVFVCQRVYVCECMVALVCVQHGRRGRRRGNLEKGRVCCMYVCVHLRTCVCCMYACMLGRVHVRHHKTGPMIWRSVFAVEVVIAKLHRMIYVYDM